MEKSFVKLSVAVEEMQIKVEDLIQTRNIDAARQSGPLKDIFNDIVSSLEAYGTAKSLHG